MDRAEKEQLVSDLHATIKASAVVEGDIRTGKLVIEDGATFNGQCRMGQAAGAAPADRPAQRGKKEADASFTVVSGDA